MIKFGTDGIRANESVFSDDFLQIFSCSIFRTYGRIKVFIARDSRLSGERIERSLFERLGHFGISVSAGGIMPTPALAYVLKRGGYDLGIMISASHNPPEYNGLKLFNAQGMKISAREERELEKGFNEPLSPFSAPVHALKLTNAEERLEKEGYCRYVESLINVSFGGKRVALDLCNGATCKTAPKIFGALGAKTKVINGDCDGAKINVNSGATYLKPLIEHCEKEKIDLGFAYDGDGDRVIAVKNGKIINGDQIIYLLQRYFELTNRLENKVVVGTINSNLALEQALLKRGVQFVRSDVGDKKVFEKMLESGANIGGESSGHVILRDYMNTGDGVLTSLFLSLIDKEYGIENLLDFELYPSVEGSVIASEKEKETFNSNEELSELLANYHRAGEMRVVVRASGTENKIRILVEGKNENEIKKTYGEIESAVKIAIKQNTEERDNKHRKMGNQTSENAKGVTVLDFNLTYIEKDVEIGDGSVIYPFNYIAKGTKIGKNCTIYPYSHLVDTEIGNGTEVRSTYSESARIGNNCTIGPFATLRKGTQVGDGCRVGNYVEIKNSELEGGVKVAHLSYVGDARVGAKTNVGCGTVFANYNGKIKQRTEVGSGVFIGCNTNLIAPLKVGDGSFIAGGSTVTKDVGENKFVISRCVQITKDKK